MFRSKNGSNGKLIIAALVLVTVTIVVWVIVAKRTGGTTSPPAVVTNDVQQNDKDVPNDTPTRTAIQQPQQEKTQTSNEPRIVMGEDVVKLPEPLEQPTRVTSAPQPQQPAEQMTPKRTETPAVNEPPADNAQSQSPRAVTHAQRLLDEGARKANAGKLVEARQTISMALEQLDPYGRDAQTARDMLSEINEILVFSSMIAPNDPYAHSQKIQSGQVLSTIARPLGVDWRFIARINDIKDPSRIQAGQSIKVINGRFHAIVRKHAFTLDLYLGEGSDRVFVRSFSVGLGELDSTPLGRFSVDSRVPNPSWKNPRTGEYFGPDDPKNPIGEYWVGIKGIEESTRGMLGYGIHGTVEPDSIGKQASMGCVRMLPDDIALIYEVLTSDLNTIEIVP